MKKFLYAILIASSLFSVSCQQNNHKNQDDDDEDVSEEKYYQDDDEEYDVTGSINSTIKNSKPDENKMMSDLVSRVISEGTNEGYHSPDWSYSIEYGQISNFRITNSVVDDTNLYTIEANMDIHPNNASFYYDTDLKLTYVNDPTNGWVLDNVTSLGMRVVSNGAYDDCITGYIGDDGWGGTYCLYLRNNCDSRLIVGGQIHTPDGWMKFAQPINGYEEKGIGGLMMSGSVDAYNIDFVVKEM